MRARRQYVDYLRDMLDAATKARRFVEGVDFAAFQGRGTPGAPELRLKHASQVG